MRYLSVLCCKAHYGKKTAFDDWRREMIDMFKKRLGRVIRCREMKAAGRGHTARRDQRKYIIFRAAVKVFVEKTANKKSFRLSEDDEELFLNNFLPRCAPQPWH
jgi:hypothetical protein